MKDFKEQIELIRYGSVDFVTPEELEQKLRKGRPLRVKFGADPSAPDLHLGHMVVLRKLKTLQDLGHKIIFLIGDFTGMIGDPTGKSETRKPLTHGEMMRNASTYQEQVFKILDRTKTEVVYNSQWLSKLDLPAVMKLMSQYTVARMLERADFKERFKGNKEISIIEFLYPLLQGYDSVFLDADIELGGHDQIFNLLVGRELQKSYGKDQQVVLTMPLLEGTDGKMKMSKSYGNYIGFNDVPKDIFGKTMSIPDGMMVKYYKLLTDMPASKIEMMEKDIKAGKVHPKDAKVALAKMFVSYFYGSVEAEKASQQFDAVFKKGGLPEDMQTVRMKTSDLGGDKVMLAKVIAFAGLVPSIAEAKRMIKAGAVKLNEEKVTDESMEVRLAGDFILSVGKRSFAKIICE